MSFDSWLQAPYYSDSYMEDRTIYCADCEFEFEEEVTISNGYYDVKCPKCEQTLYRNDK